MSELREIFEALRETASPKAWRAGKLLPGPSALEKLTRELAAEPELLPPGPPPYDRQEEARKQWQQYLTSRDPNQVRPRVLRWLCWDHKIAPTPEFLRLARQYDRTPSASMVLGLLEAYHALWDQRHEDLERQVTKWLREYQGTLQILRHLAEKADELVGPDAAKRSAHSAFEKHCAAHHLLKERGLTTDTSYAAAVAGTLLDANVRQVEHTGNLEQARYICEQLIPTDRNLLLLRSETLTSAIKRLIALASRNEDLRLRDVVKDFVLREERLGDPRRHIGRWDNLRLSAEAETVRSWLSEEDLRFFFDLIMEGQEDRHHRRDFWLRYVHRVMNSRVAIGGDDQNRLRFQLNELKKRGRSYAGLNAWDVSAFIMDFGNAIVVEFSRAGHACFVYEVKPGQKAIINLQAGAFFVSSLKLPRLASERVVHDRNGNWMYKIQQHLALRYRIRE